MKIVHVVRQFHPSIGGMEDVVLNIAQHQLRAGLAPRIVTLNRVFGSPHQYLPACDKVAGVAVQRIPYRGSHRYPLAPAVIAALQGADLCHVHGVDFFFDYLALTKPLHRLPLMASTHGGFFHTQAQAAFKRCYFHTLTRAASRAYGAIVATSANDFEVFSAIAAEGRLQLIENGVDVDKFAHAAATVPSRTIIAFGRFSRNKGLFFLLDLFSRLQRLHPDWRLLLAGREYDVSADELTAYAARLQLAAAVEIYRSPDEETLRKLIGRASYFASLSRYEGFGLAAVEGMSAGLIPILSAIPPFSKLLAEAGEGLLLEAETPLADAASRTEALHAAFLKASTQRRARCIEFSRRYSWDSASTSYNRIAEQLLAARGRVYA